MKYTQRLVNEICELLETGKYSISDTCVQVGISKQTYYRWKHSKPKFAAAIREAEVSRHAAQKEMAVSGLAKLLTGYESEEVTTIYGADKGGNPQIKGHKRVKKFVMPNPVAVIFTLTNRDPENWKNRRDLTTKGKSLNEGVSSFLKILQDASRKEDK